MSTIKIFLTDDHEVLRNSFAGSLNETEGFEVIGQASDGLETIRALETLQPDIIILDLVMRGMDGFETADWLQANRPEIKILVMTFEVKGDRLRRLLKAGIQGIVSKEIKPADMDRAIRDIAAGENYFNSIVLEQIALLMSDDPSKIQLNEKEIAFINYCATGMTYKEMEEPLGLSKTAGETLRSTVFKKFGVNKRSEMVTKALKLGIIKGG